MAGDAVAPRGGWVRGGVARGAAVPVDGVAAGVAGRWVACADTRWDASAVAVIAAITNGSPAERSPCISAVRKSRVPPIAGDCTTPDNGSCTTAGAVASAGSSSASVRTPPSPTLTATNCSPMRTTAIP